MMSPLEEARKKISKDELREGLKLVEEALGELGMEESVRRGYQNTVTVFLARYSRVQRERSMRTAEYYDMQLNGLAMDVLELIALVEEEMGKGSKVASFELNDIPSLVELIVDIDFGEKREEELEEFLTRLATMIRINPGSLTAINKKAKSIIVEGTLSTEHILKIKSLARIGLLKGLESIKGYGVKEDWKKESVGIYLVDCKLPGVQLPGADLSKADLSKIDLSGADLKGANLINTILYNANLFKTNLNRADLSGADLDNADLREATLMQATLRGVYLRGANLLEANLVMANLRWADMRNAKLKEFIPFSRIHQNSYLNKADLSGANLSGTDLSFVNLKCVNLTGANLSETNLSGANLSETNLSEANLSKANLSEANLRLANLSKANLENTNLNNANLNTTIFHVDMFWKLKIMIEDVSIVFFVDDQGQIVVKK